MREMKDSGFDYLGTIPNSWNTISLRYLFRPSAITGRPNATVLSLYRDHGIVPKDSRDDNHNVTSLDTSKYKFVRIGDFVINKMKGWQGSMALSGYEGIVSPAYHVFKFISNKLEPKYAHYLLRSRSYTDEWHKLSTGLRVGQWDLHTNDFLKTVVPLPPLDEQRRIADHLDAKCAEIDRAVASAEASIEEYKEYERVIISEAASGPWPRVRLNRIASFHNGDRSSEYPSGNDIVSKGVPFVTSDALRGRYIARQFPKHITRIKYNRLHGAKIRLNEIGRAHLNSSH